jgi:hypothetical protein
MCRRLGMGGTEHIHRCGVGCICGLRYVDLAYACHELWSGDRASLLIDFGGEHVCDHIPQIVHVESTGLDSAVASSERVVDTNNNDCSTGRENDTEWDRNAISLCIDGALSSKHELGLTKTAE